MRRGQCTVANKRSGLRALHILRSLCLYTVAAHLHLAPVIAGINSIHIYKVLSAMN